MKTAVFDIAGGDYEAGGHATRQLKEMLKRIGASPESIRRTMIAAYEAEMNTVIHARGGVMRIGIDPSQVDVSIEDTGPGISDIPQAMREGFSTAPPRARELGFGAGMGFPNIRRNTDEFSVSSTVGCGTQVRFKVLLQQETGEPARHSSHVHIHPERCHTCLACLRACPTQAVRIRNDAPAILDHLCVGCASCIEACDTGALGVWRDAEPLPFSADKCLVLPEAFLGQFGLAYRPQDILATLRELGFETIRLSSEWEIPLREAVRNYARRSNLGPIISPVCPAVMNLIHLRYASLLRLVAPFLTPIEAACQELTCSHSSFIALCPAQIAVLHAAGLLTGTDMISARALYEAVMTGLRDRKTPSPSVDETPTKGAPGDVLQVSGLGHVTAVLEALETGADPGARVLELYACQQGCFGSPVWGQDPYLAERSWRTAASLLNDHLAPARAGAVCRLKDIRPIAGIRLDPDMAKAIEKLGRMDKMAASLPGRNCGVCGAPTCSALAEDIVLGRAKLSACPYAGAPRAEELP